MNGERAGIFDGDDDPDVTGFAPKATAGKPAARPEQVRGVSEAARFRSREPQPLPQPPYPRREPRRHRTGRNIQLNIKVRPEDLETFYAIADRQGWVLGEVLERALAALQRELDAQK
jgi:hypothetical protein